VQTPSSVVRASDGKTRIDTPNQTVITNPAAQHAIVLDHLKKIATVMPMVPQPPQLPQMQPPKPGAPPMEPPKMPQMPPVAVQDLGKSLIEGHPVEGKRYIVQPPPPPQPPAPPQLPKPPAMPGLQAPQPPKPPAPPAIPPPPPAPTISEVWTSTQLKVPVLTKITTPSGVQTTYCKPAPAPEPDPSLFQIPPGYQMIVPKKP
jgi:hypothetical protein